MANTAFYVPKLLEKKVWLDWRGAYPGGYGWRHNIALSGLMKVALHHSVTNPTKNATKDVQTLYNIHRNSNGWGGIGYNFVITSEEVGGFAKVAYVGDLANARAHTPNTKGSFGIGAGYGNNHIIGICFIGSFHTGKLPTSAQLRSAHYLVEELIFKENGRMPKLANSWGTQCGHKECDPTACPANQLAKLKQLVKDTVEVVPKPAPKPAPKPPYTTTKIAPKKLQLVRDATIWDLNFTKYPDAKTKGDIKKGTVIDVTQVADHNLGSRYYLHAGGGINKVDVKDYVKPAPVPTPQPDPVDQVDVPEVPKQDPDGVTKEDLKGVNDTLARIEAIVTQILEFIKRIFK